MFLCPRCNAKWASDAARQNNFLCYRSCDTPLIDIETEAGEHLDYLDKVNLAETSNMSLRDALLAVRPGGTITLPPGRYGAPLIIEKNVYISANPGAEGKVYFQGGQTPAVIVRGARVSMQDIVLHKIGAPNDFPLLDIVTGEVELASCRFDCQFGSAINIRNGGLLSGDRIELERIGITGITCDRGSVVKVKKLELLGRTSAGEQAAVNMKSEELAQTGLQINSGATVSIDDIQLSRFVYGINAGEARIEIGSAEVDLCETAFRCEKSDLIVTGGSISVHSCGLSFVAGSVEISGVSLNATQGAVFAGEDCQALKLTGCDISGGDRSISLKNCLCVMENCKIDGEKQLLELSRTKLVGRNNQFTTKGGAIRTNGESFLKQQVSQFSSGENGIELGANGKLEFENVEFTDFSGCCIIQAHGTASVLRESKFNKSGTACYLLSSSTLELTDSAVTLMQGAGIIGHQGSQISLSNVNFSKSGADHIVLGSLQELDSKISNCSFSESGGSAIVILENAKVDCRDCDIKSTGLQGIMVGSKGQLSLYDTSIEESGGSFIVLLKNAKMLAKGLKARRTEGSGIVCDHAANCTITNSSISNCSESALFSICSTSLNMSDVEITDIEQQGVLAVNTSKLELCKLRINDCKGSGVDSIAGDTFMLTDSEIKSSANAVQLTGKMLATIERSILTGGPRLGMKFVGGAEVKCSDCTLSGSRGKVRVESRARTEIRNMDTKRWQIWIVRRRSSGKVKWKK